MDFDELFLPEKDVQNEMISFFQHNFEANKDSKSEEQKISGECRDNEVSHVHFCCRR